MNIYEIFRFKDTDHRNVSVGHISFVCADTYEKALHKAANKIPRYWMWCGVRESNLDTLTKKIDSLSRDLNDNLEIMKCITSGTM